VLLFKKFDPSSEQISGNPDAGAQMGGEEPSLQLQIASSIRGRSWNMVVTNNNQVAAVRKN
jgi:hypothetical protein